MSTFAGITIQSETIGHALKDNSLAVPVYQRSYAWEEKHVTELYQDLGRSIDKAEPEYFLGSIVITRNDGGRSEVVDGQQRLATVMILLAAIRDFFCENGDPRAEDIERDYLKSRVLRSQEELPNLSLNETDNDYFVKRVLSRPGDPSRKLESQKGSHDRIDAAANLAKQHIDDLVRGRQPHDQTDQVLRWVEFIDEGARVIWVTAPDDANAFMIFETLNDRGLALSISDLLKNHLLSQSGNRIRETQQRWYEMTGALETVGDEEIIVTYIRHLWISFHGATRERELYASIKAKINTKQSAIDFAAQLAQYANQYAALLNTQHQFWNGFPASSRKSLETLNSLRMEQFRPLLLAAISHFSRGEIAKCLGLLVCCSVRFLVVGKVGGSRQELNYAMRALEIRDGKIRTARQLEKAMAEVVPGDPQFQAAFAVARVSQGYLARYYLRQLELQAMSKSDHELVPNEAENVNLEHVLPQSPSSAWPNVDSETARGYAKRLGNLLLLTAAKNSAIGNKAFRTKKQQYAKSQFTLTKAVATYQRWGPKEIDARQKQLAELAVRTWPYKP